MSKWEMRDGSGSLFRNDKEGNESRPDYRGEIMVGGQIYWISAWIKQGKNDKFLSLSVKPKPDKAPEVLPSPKGGIAEMEDDSLPF